MELMDVCESNQTLDTRKSPLFIEKNNGRIHQPLTVSSRYKSPTSRRFPSPNATRTVTSQPAPVKKRAVSTGRRQVAQPPLPPSPNTPIHDTSVFAELSARNVSASKMSESLWPSRMRSLSVAFQSNSFSMPVSKREKPPPQTIYDRSLKPSLNVTQKQTVVSSSPAYRKATTPERKRSPLKGKNPINQSENSKPLDGVHTRLADQLQWPSRIGSNGFNKSIDLVDESIKRSSSPNVRRISNLVSSNSKNGELLPSSPNKSLGGSRGVSPCRTRAMVNGPARGVSPMRSSSPSRQLCNNSNNTASVLTFIADIKKGKKVANRIEDAHNLRLLYNRQVQWRFVNASAESVLNSQKLTAEKSLINAQRTTSQLKDSVAAKKMKICQLKLQLKLYMALNQQIGYLNQWCSIERDHRFALHGVIEDLQASTLRLPVTGCATANIQSVKSAFCSAIQVMQTMGSSIKSTLSTYDETNWLVSELATVVAQERALLDQCESLIAFTSSLQVEEYSFRTNLVQLKQGLKRV
ncbi:AUGMIN subunit 8-like [Rutidosis leptorrhynchoides]|uniref:AUGMIN subunit 8-like n=1 Tax=Rutidosis leptorrhynchoides TaxID=125765 RepID=UPI003A9A0E64